MGLLGLGGDPPLSLLHDGVGHLAKVVADEHGRSKRQEVPRLRSEPAEHLRPALHTLAGLLELVERLGEDGHDLGVVAPLHGDEATERLAAVSVHSHGVLGPQICQ